MPDLCSLVAAMIIHPNGNGLAGEPGHVAFGLDDESACTQWSATLSASALHPCVSLQRATKGRSGAKDQLSTGCVTVCLLPSAATETAQG